MCVGVKRKGPKGVSKSLLEFLSFLRPHYIGDPKKRTTNPTTFHAWIYWVMKGLIWLGQGVRSSGVPRISVSFVECQRLRPVAILVCIPTLG